MKPRLAINGYGRIGQCILRAWAERDDCRGLDMVALNELSDLDTLAYLTRYDTIHGRFPGKVETRNEQLWIDNHPISVLCSATPDGLPWADLNIDLLLECTGSFKDRTTIHSVMNDQPVSDAYNKNDLRLTRSAMASIIPVETGLAKGIYRLLPHLEGRIASTHLRVPTLNVSAMDLTLCVKRDTNVVEINQLLRTASEGALQGIMGYTEEPNASVDFNHDPRSSIIDATQTHVAGKRLVKLLCWFDNEWGFANRMLDVALHWLALEKNTKK